jgi:hypothetical protein
MLRCRLFILLMILLDLKFIIVNQHLRKETCENLFKVYLINRE